MKKLPLLIVLLFLPIAAFAQNSIEGVWSRSQFPSWDQTSPLNLSWGKGNMPSTWSIAVDLHSNTPAIYFDGLSYRGSITDITEKGNTVEIRYKLVVTYMEIGEIYHTAVFNFNEDGSVHIGPILDEASGDEMLSFYYNHYRTDGPEEVMAADRQRRSLAFSKTHTLPYDMPLYKDYNRKLPIVAESPIITTLSKGSDVQLITVRQTEIKEDGIKLLYNHSASSQFGEIRRTQIPGSTTETWAGVITESGWLGWLKSDFFLPEEESEQEHTPLFFLLMPLSLLAVLVLLLVLIVRLIDGFRKKRQAAVLNNDASAQRNERS